MGYRHYLYEVENRDIKSIQNLTAAQAKSFSLFEYNVEDDHMNLWPLLLKIRYEFGKLYHCDTVKRVHDISEKLFNNEELYKRFEDFEPHIIRQEQLKLLIDICHEKTIEGLKETLNINRCEDFINEIIIKFRLRNIVDINTENERVINSFNWLYMFTVVELTHILKTFDWENKSLIFVGH